MNCFFSLGVISLYVLPSNAVCFNAFCLVQYSSLPFMIFIISVLQASTSPNVMHYHCANVDRINLSSEL